jgi:hypothetical protein
VSPECQKCGLILHRKRNPVPPEGELAWSIYKTLAGSAVQAFNLHSDVLDALNLDMDKNEFLELIEMLNALMEGIDKAVEDTKDKP